MSVLVVTNLLLLLRDVDCDLDGLSSVAESSIKLKRMLWLLRNVISFAHKVVHKLMSQSVKLCLGNHFDHIRDGALTLLDVKLESFIQLLTLLIMLGSTSPLRLALKVLGNA